MSMFKSKPLNPCIFKPRTPFAPSSCWELVFVGIGVFVAIWFGKWTRIWAPHLGMCFVLRSPDLGSATTNIGLHRQNSVSQCSRLLWEGCLLKGHRVLKDLEAKAASHVLFHDFSACCCLWLRLGSERENEDSIVVFAQMAKHPMLVA